MSEERVCRPMVERVDTGEWESWCRAHPLPNGDTGRVYDTHAEAMADALKHAKERS